MRTRESRLLQASTFALAASVLVFESNALAANTSQLELGGGYGGLSQWGRRGGVNLDRDLQLVRQAITLAERHQFVMASYKLRTVRADIITLRQSAAKDRLIEALDISIEKLNDYRLAAYEKIAVIRDCGRVAKSALRQLGAGNGYGGGGGHLNVDIRSAPRVAHQITNHVQYGQMRLALRKLNAIRLGLQRYQWDHDIIAALQTLDLFEQKLRDPQLSLRQKLAISRDCVQVLNQKIVNSRAYRGGGGGGYGRLVHLGQTGKFDKAIYDTESIYLHQTGRRLRTLIFQVERNALIIDNIEIVFANGRRQQVYGRSLRSGESFNVQLRGGRVSAVHIVGMTNGLFGSRAKVSLSGR